MQTVRSFYLMLIPALVSWFIFVPVTVSAESPGVVSGTVRIVDRAGRELQDRSNVVVFIDGVVKGVAHLSTSKIPMITHAGMPFTPRVVPIVRGQEVNFLNDDVIFHNVFSLSKPKVFDLGIYPEGTTKLLSFDKTGLVKIYCNMHPNMIGNVLVLNNSLFAVTDAAGKFEITNVPDGEFTLRVWHEFADPVGRSITVADGNRVTESFDVKETKTIRRHKNKFGKEYKKKY